MAKFQTIIIAVALFCLFTFSFAGDATVNDESTAEEAAIRLPSDSVTAETESNSAAVTYHAPLKKIKFRPINRRFTVRSAHPCRHHFKFHPTANEEVPYGNDMLVATEEKTDFQIHGHALRVRIHHRRHHHHDEDSDSDSDSDGEDDIRYQKKLRKRFSEEGNTKKVGFMKRVRMFLDHYF